tara:strand:+ start:140 stop:2284 length:2145 start_codon:yes stop_codon:yes gene_type:complete
MAPDRKPHSGSPTAVAVVGAGYIADFHLEVLCATPGVHVVAVCDVDRARAQAVAQAHGIEGVATDLADLPAMGVQVVHLCVPPDLHVPLTRKVLELGMGAYVEKPLALNAADAAELQQLSQSTGQPLGVNHNNVFHPSFRRLVRRLEAGEIGTLSHVRVALSVPVAQLDAQKYDHWMFRAERNIVFEQAVHPLSQIHHLIGAPERVEPTILSTRELNPGQRFHERWVVAGQGERGSVEIYLHFGAPFTRCTLEVFGSDGSLEADLFHDQLASERKVKWLDFWNSYLAGARRGRQLRGDARRVLTNWMRFTLGIGPRKDAFFVGMHDSIQAFHASLRGGPAYLSGPQEAVEVTQWCDALGEGLPTAPAPAPVFPESGPAREGEILVLGGSGFIGTRVVTRLLERGRHVTCAVRRLRDLPPEVVEPALDGRLRLVQTSLGDTAGMARALDGIQTCVHLATGGGDSWEAIQKVMVTGSREVTRQCVDAGVRRLIYVSSVAALYNGPEGPADIDDATPQDPRIDEREMYSRGKAYAERAVRDAALNSKLEVVIARPGVVVGEGTPMQHTGLGLWARDNHCVGWGKGDRHLALVWVDDVAEALVRAAVLEGDALAGKDINLCANVPLTARDVVEELARHTGRDLHFHPRSLYLSQLMEIGKWLVKKAGRRPGVTFPSFRDLKSRGLARPYKSDLSRSVLDWKPLEDRETFLEKAIRVYR